ncbi:hypothetical protein V6N12_068952 [Hibiscus sabdariffa]|uniref:Uncharacterized protein n=1 Tax=Hibiscus sabdariffa TaxID=183260 RepID=A0ABR2CAB3_9ROSI
MVQLLLAMHDPGIVEALTFTGGLKLAIYEGRQHVIIEDAATTIVNKLANPKHDLSDTLIHWLTINIFRFDSFEER